MLFITFFGQAQTDPKPFITTWETKTPNETIIIPIAGGGYSYTVNWGEDEPADNNTYTGAASHDYADAGTHIVTISGTFPRIFFQGNRTSAGQIRSVQQWGDIAFISMFYAFRRCSNLSIAEEAGVPNLSGVTDMFGMFQESSFNGDLSKWDISKVTNMESMFQSSDFNGDLSKWDISSVTNITNMFNNNTSMSSENYDKLLIGWSTLDTNAGETKIPENITFSAPGEYSCAGAGARNKLRS
ncbi:MAG: BspA family leucine-rich repeat surface protein, partial [Ekhidna sp.]|nr:BspA family leucine-rich repeat surface protein [Ekhidna sp.]